ncbi:hypothetical protein DEO72_LG6g1048 [Vigna unguiculata]|uniref:Uncharacterized protein n=1 Tax=Vigna unguiculata TaxID=3917 RepID=A0A4D6M898_VIGUN|nr:hypothetical protein DEO72_LG6g1048 [Vigna unguiculata]
MQHHHSIISAPRAVTAATTDLPPSTTNCNALPVAATATSIVNHHCTCEPDSNPHTLRPLSHVIFSVRKPWRQRRRSCTFISHNNHHLLPHESATEHAPDLLSSRTTINARQNQSALALRIRHAATTTITATTPPSL